MVYEFTATDCEADLRNRFVGFSDGTHYVWIQPDDDRLTTPSGDQIWLEIIDQKFGGPGGMQKMILSRNQFDVLLTFARAKITGGYDSIRVHFSISDSRCDELKRALAQVLRGSEQLLEMPTCSNGLAAQKSKA